jgi:hypothetical protein
MAAVSCMQQIICKERYDKQKHIHTTSINFTSSLEKNQALMQQKKTNHYVYITVGAMGASMEITSKKSFHQNYLDFSYLGSKDRNNYFWSN